MEPAIDVEQEAFIAGQSKGLAIGVVAATSYFIFMLLLDKQNKLKDQVSVLELRIEMLERKVFPMTAATSPPPVKVIIVDDKEV